MHAQKLGPKLSYQERCKSHCNSWWCETFQDLNDKALVRSIWWFLLNQNRFSKSSFTQNSTWVKIVYGNFWLSSSSTCLCPSPSIRTLSSFKKFKITFVSKHEYSVVINGCPEARTKAFFSVTVWFKLQQLLMWDFFRTLMAKRWSDPSDGFFLTRITFPNPPSPPVLPSLAGTHGSCSVKFPFLLHYSSSTTVPPS